MKIIITNIDALVVVDMQRDFMPSGALPVPEADTIIPKINDYTKLFASKERPIFFTRDYHPKDHISFRTQGGLWPEHCVEGSEGAKFHQDLLIPADNRYIISKGTSKDFDAYSGFQGTILHDLLQERGIRRLFICGVATEYCVKNTLLGAINLGYETFLLIDAIKGLEGSKEAIEQMLRAGAVGVERISLE